jgi:hypothetical protein
MEDINKPRVPTSDDIRDELATVLHKVITSGVPVKDEETGEVHLDPPPAAYLAVARAYLKDHPPATLPAAGSPTGLLKKHMDGLPFGAKGKH